jgi:hypothetical protein
LEPSARRCVLGRLLGTTGIGYVQDYYSAAKLSQDAPPLYQQYAAADKKSFLVFPPTTGLDGSEGRRCPGQTGSRTVAARANVRSAVIYGGRMSLKWTALVPAIMAVGYLLLILYFKAKGGYQQVHIEGVGKQAKEVV